MMNKIGYSGFIKGIAVILFAAGIVGGVLAFVGRVRTFFMRRKDHA